MPSMLRIIILCCCVASCYAHAGVLVPTILRIPSPSASADAEFGLSLTAIGDVNGDGVADLLVGAPGADKAFVISGKDQTVLRTISDPDGLTGNRFGFAVAAAGDWNGDGIPDFAIGSPGPEGIVPLPCLDPCTPDPSSGRVFVFSGASGALIRKISPPGEAELFGYSLANLGDVNGDGKPDLAVGMPVHARFFGSVFAFSGSNGALLWQTTEPGQSMGQRQPLASFGEALADIPDINGDGSRDLLVGAIFHDSNPDPAVDLLTGSAYVLSGATGAILRTHDDPSPANNHDFGFALQNVGDQDGDGIPDYGIGAPGAGKIYLFRGSDGSLIRTITSPGSAGDFFGSSIASVSDYDHDSVSDFWVGAAQSQHAYLINGVGAVLLEINDPSPDATSSVLSFGLRAAQTPNLGGDTGGDVVVADPGEAAGAAYIILVHENHPPLANPGLDQIIECRLSGPAVVLDGSGSSDPDGDPLTFEWKQISGPAVTLETSGATASFASPGVGTYVFELKVTDNHGASAMGTIKIVVQDTVAPQLSVVASPDSLWPPNHKLMSVNFAVQVNDACDLNPLVALISAVSNQPANDVGDGNTSPDIVDANVGTDNRHILLRAERSGTGSDRVYTITYRATDASNNSSSAAATVTVPHSSQ